jgi:hypothetical protein
MKVCPCVAAACVVLAAIVLAGCGSSGGAPTSKVTGVVTYKGTPVADAGVTFTPEKGRPASGITDAAGKFTLSTFAKDDGAVPGLHKVAVTPNASQIEPMPGTPEAAAAAVGKPPFPKRYNNPETSALTADVKDGEDNNFTFDMTD